MIYLDHNATTPPAPEVVDAVCMAVRDLWANPSSQYRAGQQAKAAIEKARRQVADLVNVKPSRVTFTSSGTEAVQAAIRGAIEGPMRRNGRRAVVITAGEHRAALGLCEALDKRGIIELRIAKIGRCGRVDHEEMERLVDEDVGLVCVQWANNETGAIQPVARAIEIAKRSGALTLCDATQWVGKLPTDLGEGPCDPDDGQDPRAAAEADMVTFAPHKFHGPRGVGVLVEKPGLDLAPASPGAQERGRRGGTENTPSIIGAGVACKIAKERTSDPELIATQTAKRDRLEALLKAELPEMCVACGESPRVWNTSCVLTPGIDAEPMLMALSEPMPDGPEALAVSSGSACSSGSIEASHVLTAMGLERTEARSAIRLSLCFETTDDEIDRGAEAFIHAARQLIGTPV